MSGSESRKWEEEKREENDGCTIRRNTRKAGAERREDRRDAVYFTVGNELQSPHHPQNGLLRMHGGLVGRRRRSLLVGSGEKRRRKSCFRQRRQACSKLESCIKCGM